MNSAAIAGRLRAFAKRAHLHSPLASKMASRVDWAGWRSFVISVFALGAALLLALYSSVAAEDGRTWIAALCALSALVVSGWVAFTVVPALARRTPLQWLAYRMDYRVTREGLVYLAGIFIIAMAALNTGNNLLFMTLACLLGGILVSGIISQVVLSGVELRLDLPEHIFAHQTVLALAELENHKTMLPSFSLRLVGAKPPRSRGRGGSAPPDAPLAKKSKRGNEPASDILSMPVYFPYLPPRQKVQQAVELVFPRRGVYRQDSIGLQTRFPFGFLEKTRQVESRMEALVYPSVAPSEEFYEILPLVTGELESLARGRGHDLYSIREYQTSDSARHVDWKASARTGALQVREFAREDERRVLLVLDAAMPADERSRESREAIFERGVALCASLAWHFHEIDSVLAFRSGTFETPMATAGEIIYAILRFLASASPADSDRSVLGELVDLPQTFKIILTAQPRGSIPTSLWSTSYIAFLE
jgi:uncharacterized protein (DUF58 family)